MGALDLPCYRGRQAYVISPRGTRRRWSYPDGARYRSLVSRHCNPSVCWTCGSCPDRLSTSRAADYCSADHYATSAMAPRRGTSRGLWPRLAAVLLWRAARRRPPDPMSLVPSEPVVAGMYIPRSSGATCSRSHCSQDLQQFCHGVQPGEGRLIRCLSSHQSQLSPSCISRLAAARPAPGVAPPSESTQSSGLPSANPPAAHAVTETALRASCGPDVKRLCDGIFRNNSGVIKCLSAHRMELSVTCDLFFKEMPVERAAQKSAPKTTTAKSPAAIPAVNGAADIGAPPAANGPATTPAAPNGAADTGAPPAANGPASTNGAADTGVPPGAHDRAATPATADSAADTGAASAGNGPAATPAAANGATDLGPPALTAQPTKNAPPAASSPPARGALAFPL